MKRRASFLLCFLFVGGFSSCNLLPVPNPGFADATAAVQYETVSALLTETAGVTRAATQTPALRPQHTQPGIGTSTPVPTLSIEPRVTGTLPATASLATQKPDSSAIVLPCNLAQPGRPLDVTVPDDSRYYPGEYFSKTWRLINAGQCEWTREYATVWFSGEDIGVNQEQPFNVIIAPGNSYDVTVDMIAPLTPGVYQSNWKLRNGQNEMFGIGPNGDAPFWVRIVVIPFDTPTVTPQPPAVTATPIVYSSGSMFVDVDQGADLDSGLTNQADRDDFQLQVVLEGQAGLSPINGARMTLFGASSPEPEDCLLSTMLGEPVGVDQILEGSYLCYRTTEGLPGRVLVSSIDLEQNQISLEFTTWAVP